MILRSFIKKILLVAFPSVFYISCIRFTFSKTIDNGIFINKIIDNEIIINGIFNNWIIIIFIWYTFKCFNRVMILIAKLLPKTQQYFQHKSYAKQCCQIHITDDNS